MKTTYACTYVHLKVLLPGHGRDRLPGLVVVVNLLVVYTSCLF